MSQTSVLRIIDANLNRASEGLRVLEEIARFILDDAELSQKLKNIRHELVSSDLMYNKELLLARDAEGDVGADITAPGQEETKELSVLAVANSRRVQEALRVLEEIAKVKGIPLTLSSEKYERARFAVYTLEQEIVFKLLRQEKLKFIKGLYAIIDTEALKGRPHAALTREVIRGGTRVIQLRDKVSTRQELYLVACEVRNICADAGVLFIVNDYLDLALAVGADGLHIGQTDLPLSEARRLLPPDKILGISTQTVAQAIQAEKDGADYIGAGAVFSTTSKPDAKVSGLTMLSEIRRAVKLPIVAIGGITLQNVGGVIAAGADSAAVISAILSAQSPEEAAKQFVAKFKSK
jgi:thiamine-phosphate pyrophosphorylase